ncbi:uncharacterized protein BDZ99DRAFT_513791 [Mytilinidion resinicola]|uniref:Aminoglycoside phosphotransferase domain-containing protein n=1 Tax=Mytilinidion resinicola TaxID=574789 RepID=A0A6A6Z9Z0_9PEZI|nr:uncharacterized protein BDZ99DRAFT_513791 [Mytilinidion resinicola]KAF2817553.1 hypothetical protein BDZ99DRAFT_513791 [Mytilinidion resinicola]
MRTRNEVLLEHYGVTTDDEIFRFQIDERNRPSADQVVVTKFPYEAPEHPGIPSMAEIEKGMRNNHIAQPGAFFEVCRIGKCAVKRGNWLVLQEAENLLFLEKHSKVRTPKLYAAFIQPGERFNVHYMVTEFIEGEVFDEAKWLALDEHARETICSKLSEQFQRLRAIPPEGYYGRVYHQPLRGAYHGFMVNIRGMCGPYETYEECASAMYASAELRGVDSFGDFPDYLPHVKVVLPQIKEVLEKTRGSKPVLTHMDPKFTNILIRSIKGAEGKKEDWEVVLIDWESLAWLPAWLQTVALNNKIDLFGEAMAAFMLRVTGGFGDPYTLEKKTFKKSYEIGYYIP